MRTSRRTQRLGPLLVATVLAACVAAAPALAKKAAAPAPARKESAGKSADAESREQKGEDPGSYFATTFGHAGDETMLIYYWSRGALFRSETVVGGHPIITIVNGDFYYTLDGLSKAGYAIRRSASAIAAERKRERPFANELEGLLAQGGEKLRSEQMSGVDVDVYRVTNDSGKTTLWVTSDSLRLPIRIENFDRQSGRSGRLDWVKWVPGLVISERFFEPPPDAEIERFDSYEAFAERQSKEPVRPMPPLFQGLIHQPGS